MNALNYVIVYSGPHYGRPHRLLSGVGSTWTAWHEPTGEVVTFLKCDCEPATEQPVTVHLSALPVPAQAGCFTQGGGK